MGTTAPVEEPEFRIRPLGGRLGCLVMLLVSVAGSVLLTVLLNLLIR